jgi:site-specific DNA-methyltransferase (adenine-specific)
MTTEKSGQASTCLQKDELFILAAGNCLETLRGMADNSVDSIVTDPPYGLSFMGRKWDYDVPGTEIWAECMRVLKPGGHLLAFAGTRTQHRMAVRIEDAGFEIRDMIAWVYGSGFPKSLDVSKAIDGQVLYGGSNTRQLKMVNENRPGEGRERKATNNNGIVGTGDNAPKITRDEPATQEGAQWQGWGTALKPALEPITVARKPLAGTVAINVLQHGTGALNIDGCRVAASDGYTENAVTQGINTSKTSYAPAGVRRTFAPSDVGRWPANLIHDGSDEVLAGFPQTGGGNGKPRIRDGNGSELGQSGGWNSHENKQAASQQYADTGSAARFFYVAKASKADRDEGLEKFVMHPAAAMQGNMVTGQRQGGDGAPIEVPVRANTHPTVKPTDLMAYLCRLVTPSGGVVLDPFMGSGSTGKAAMREGFNFVGIEREAEYLEIARARIAFAERQASVEASQHDLFGEAA